MDHMELTHYRRFPWMMEEDPPYTPEERAIERTLEAVRTAPSLMSWVELYELQRTLTHPKLTNLFAKAFNAKYNREDVDPVVWDHTVWWQLSQIISRLSAYTSTLCWVINNLLSLL